MIDSTPKTLTNQGARRKIEGILPSSQNAPQTKTEPLQSKQEHQMEHSRAWRLGIQKKDGKNQ